jgi:FixJ family two-component response regulator
MMDQSDCTIELKPKLSPRERQVLAGVLDGKLSKTMAHELGIGKRTVDVYRHNLIKKFGASNTATLVRIVATQHSSFLELI